MAGASHSRLRMIADSQLGGGATSWAPGTWYLGWSTTESDAEGNGFTEPPSGVGYARIALTNNPTNFPPAVTEGGRTTKTNGTQFFFADPTGPWGTIVFVGFFVALTGGLPESAQPLDTPLTVSVGNTPVGYEVGQLIMRFRGRV